VVVVGVMMVVVVMVPRGAKGRGGKDHQQQGCGKILFHASNVARERVPGKTLVHSESRKERVNPIVQELCPRLPFGNRFQRKLKAR
jgi:hypothetical protein